MNLRFPREYYKQPGSWQVKCGANELKFTYVY